MPSSPFADRIMVCDSRLLRGLWNPVDVTAQRDDRLAGSPGCYPRCRYSRDPFLDLEAILLERVDQVAGSLELLKAKLTITEHLIHHLSREILHLLDVRDGFLLERVQPAGGLSKDGNGERDRDRHRK